MSSALERRAGRGLVLRLMLTNALLLAVAGAALWFAAIQVVRLSLAADWELKREQVAASLRAAGEPPVADQWLRDDFVLLSLPPAAQRRLEQHLVEVLPLLLGVVVLAALVLGGWLAYRQTQPLRELARRAQALAAERQPARRLLPAWRHRGDVAELAALFDRLLDRNHALVRTMHESLDSIGHDLRTPMTRLRAVAEQALHGDDPEAMRDALGCCIEESEQALRLLATLVDLSHAESGTLALARADTAVAALLESVRDLYELVAEERHVRLQVECAADLIVPLDAIRARQAIANCVDNAVKYGADGDVVVLRAAPLAGGGARIEVEDHGGGIAEVDLGLIWQRLFRGDRARSSAGLGLGLSVVRAIVEAHGGRVDASSAPGKTVIGLEFPAAPAAAS